MALTMGSMTAVPAAAKRHRARVSAAVAVAGLCGKRSKRKVFVIVKTDMNASPMRPWSTNGTDMSPQVECPFITAKDAYADNEYWVHY
jgi:hypothetical protein